MVISASSTGPAGESSIASTAVPESESRERTSAAGAVTAVNSFSQL